MTIESTLSKKLQQFSIIDYSFVKLVYVVFGFLIFSVYPKLSSLDWWFYLVLFVICALPLYVHLLSQPGGLIDKLHGYLKSNNLALQMLLAMTCFFFALMLGVLLPVLVSAAWWVYLIIMIVLAIKPLTVSWFW